MRLRSRPTMRMNVFVPPCETRTPKPDRVSSGQCFLALARGRQFRHGHVGEARAWAPLRLALGSEMGALLWVVVGQSEAIERAETRRSVVQMAEKVTLEIFTDYV